MENIDVGNVIKNDNTAGAVASSLVERVILGSDPTNVHNASIIGNQATTAYTAVSSEDDLVNKINNHTVATGGIQAIEEPVVAPAIPVAPVAVEVPKINLAEVIPAGQSGSLDVGSVQGIIDNLQNMFSEAYEKKFKDLEMTQQRKLEEFKMEAEKEKISKMTEAEKKAYQTELEKQAEMAKLKFMEQRIKELEDEKKAADNRAYIQQQINLHPYTRSYIDKMNIKTKEEFKLKIEPIINDIKELEMLRTNNSRFGNANALGGFNKKSDERKDITESIKANVSSFLDQVIMR